MNLFDVFGVNALLGKKRNGRQILPFPGITRRHCISQVQSFNFLEKRIGFQHHTALLRMSTHIIYGGGEQFGDVPL
jgi:hypothetical protein